MSHLGRQMRGAPGLNNDQDRTMATTYDELEVGDSYSTRQEITTSDLERFAALTDQPLARERGQITHGLLLGYISKILGHDFPGHGTVAVAMSTNFLCAPNVDAYVEFEVTVIGKHEERGHVEGRVTATSDGLDLLEGTAMLIPPGADDANTRR